jgi:O-antigen ligase
VAVESGIPSALVFAAIWILAAREGYRLYRRKGEAELVGTFTLAGIVGLLTLSLTNAKPIEDPMPMMAMFILFVLPYCARRELT